MEAWKTGKMIDRSSARTIRAADVSVVPREFIGRARDLLKRLGEADARIEPAVRAVMMPLLRRLDRRPVLRRDMLIDAERRWRNLVPAFGRLAMEVDGENLRSPCFIELRVVRGVSRRATWPDEGQEPGVLVGWHAVEFDERAMASWFVSLASVSLHALARRYQRGWDTSDTAIFAELAVLAHDFRQAVALPRFAVAVPGGAWVGEPMNAGESMVLAVRTFYDADSGARIVTTS
jgi:hypothetical protein